MVTDVDQVSITSTIRRMLRVLGAMPSHVSDPEAVARAAQLVHDRMSRTEETVEWFEPHGYAPLVAAGTGPILLVTYLDDSDPYSSSHSGQPPAFRQTSVSGPGIVRKAGVVAAAAAQLDSEQENRFTVVVETDRNAGSKTLEEWLRKAGERFRAAIWESIDIPAHAPLIVHSATGCLMLRVVVSANHHFAESQFGGVLPDLGRQLSAAIGELVSDDHEVRLGGFYDGIDEVDEQAFETYQGASAMVTSWLRRIAPGEFTAPGNHLAMGAFLAPGVVVRGITLTERSPYLSVAGEALIDIHLLPGQDISKVLRSVGKFFNNHIPGTEVEVLLARPPVTGKANLTALRESYPRVLKTGPGLNPAGVIESYGIPTVGYAAVTRNPENTSGRVTLEEIVNGSRLIQSLSRRMAS